MKGKITRPWQKQGKIDGPNGPGMPQAQKVNPQITITLVGNKVGLSCNFKDWDMTISLLIDGLRAASSQKKAEKDSNIIVAEPSLVTLG